MSIDKLSKNQIVENWELHKKIVSQLDEDTCKKVLNMYDTIGEEVLTAPASLNINYHNCFIGGYLDHVNRVVEFSFKYQKFFNELGLNIDFTESEIIKSALFHDLGKLGDVDKPYYIVEDSEWHRKNRGTYYKINTDLDYMKAEERSLYLLQKFGISLTQKEYLAIKLSNGLYEESNKSYYLSYNPSMKIKTNLVYLIHKADHLAVLKESNN